MLLKNGDMIQARKLPGVFVFVYDFRDSIQKKIKMIAGGKGLFGSPFSHVLSFHNSFLYISNFTDIFYWFRK